MTMFYAKLANRLSREKVFYAIVGIFLAFFASFTFILYPLRESLHLNAFADSLESILPLG